MTRSKARQYILPTIDQLFSNFHTGFSLSIDDRR